MYMENYALVQYQQGNSEKAIETLVKYLPMIKGVGDYETFVQASTTLSSMLIEEKQFERASLYITQGLKVAEDHHFPVEKCEIVLNLSKVLWLQKKFGEALQYGEEAYFCASNRSDYQQQMKAAKNLLSVYLANRDHEKARELFPVYNELIERHFDTEEHKTYAKLEAEYQTRRKEAENNLLKAQQLKNEAKIKEQRNFGWTFLLIGLLAAVGAFYAYYIQHTQKDLLEKKVEERTKALHESYSNLEQSNEELARSNEELERFAYIASHDLKQPLNTVISFSNLLNKQLNGASDGHTKSYLNFIINGGNQMKQLIEDILEYSTLSEEKGKPQLIDLNHLVIR